MTPDRFGFVLWLSLLGVVGLLVYVYVWRLNLRAARAEAARSRAESAVDRANATIDRWRAQVDLSPPTEDLRGTARLAALHAALPPVPPPMNARHHRHDPPVSKGGPLRPDPRPRPWVDESL